MLVTRAELTVLILWNSIALTSIVVTELANTMKYKEGVLYNFVFNEFPFKTVYTVLQSSVLMSMLGEMTVTSGELNVKGSTAYVPQQAWLFSATLRENILLGSEKDGCYDNVIEACGLADVSIVISSMRALKVLHVIFWFFYPFEVVRYRDSQIRMGKIYNCRVRFKVYVYLFNLMIITPVNVLISRTNRESDNGYRRDWPFNITMSWYWRAIFSFEVDL